VLSVWSDGLREEFGVKDRWGRGIEPKGWLAASASRDARATEGSRSTVTERPSAGPRTVGEAVRRFTEAPLHGRGKGAQVIFAF
jgi:hypothetical protein